jgi:PAS domain S-box-containing protein
MAALTILVALVVAGSAYVVIESERARRLVELENRATQFASLLGRSLAQPLWNVDVRAIDLQLSALFDSDEVAELSVTGLNYGPVSRMTKAQAATLRDPVARVWPIEYSAFPGVPATRIGEVRVVLSRTATDAGIAEFRRAILLVAGATIASLYAATFALLRWMVRGPVRRLEETVDRIAGGDLHARCRVESGDELGRLAVRINAMADGLLESTGRLRKSEGRYRGIFETVGVSIWEEDFFRLKAAIDELKAQGVADLRGYLAAHPDFVQHAMSLVRIVDVNAATLELFAAETKGELLESLHKVFVAETETIFAEAIIAVAEGRESFEAEMVLQTLKGETLTVLLTIRFPRVPAEFDSVLVSMTDVTEIRRAEQDRRAHLQFFESMDRVNRAIQGANDIEQMLSDVLDTVLSIFACDRAWLVYPCDPEAPTWRAVMEQTRPEFPGAFALDRDLPVDADIAKVFQMARASDDVIKFIVGGEHPPPGGIANPFHIQSVIGMVLYPKGDKPYMFGLHQCTYPRVWTPQEEQLFREIGRRLADALTTLLILRDLRESRAKLEQAQRIANLGYWERDIDADRSTWSDEMYHILGQPWQEAPMARGRVLQMVHPEDRDMMRRALAEALQSGRRYDVEYRAVRPDGEVRIVHSLGDVTRDQSGRPRRMFGILQDITERKRAEEVLHHTQAELAHVNRVATLNQLTASIAHELSQPIAGAAASGHAALRWLVRETPDLEATRRAIERVIRDTNRAGDVINRARDLIKKASPRKDRFDINEAIREVVALTFGEARKNGISVQTQLAEDLPLIEGDRVQVQQVILNLVVNAIEAMSGIGLEPRELHIKTEKADTDVVLVAVQDSGPGLDPENPERVFDAFYTTKAGGLGIGLSICRSIIKAHGGRLWASESLPHGAIFQFTVPAVTTLDHALHGGVAAGPSVRMRRDASA